MSFVAPLSYARVKPPSEAVSVELVGDGGVRVRRLIVPSFRERFWASMIPYFFLLLNVLSLALLMITAFDPHMRGWSSANGAAWGLAVAFITWATFRWIAHVMVRGVVVEIAVRQGHVECVFARALWPKRKRWTAAAIKSVAIGLEFTNRQWTRVPCLRLRRKGTVAITAFVGSPHEELEWAVSALRDALASI